MATISVGSTITYKGRNCICTSHEIRRSVSYAKVNSTFYREQQQNLGNSHYMELDVADFSEGELITTELEFIELTEPGKNLYYIYTKYKVTKMQQEGEQTDGIERREDVSEQSSGDEVEAADGWVEGGEGAGGQGPGEAGGELYRDGSGGEGGAAVHPPNS